MFHPNTMICVPTNRICASVGELVRECSTNQLVQTITTDPFHHSTRKITNIIDDGSHPCVKVTLDDNSDLTVEDDTKFLMYASPSSNTFKAACSLVSGDVLWSALGMVLVKSVEAVDAQPVHRFKLEGQDDAVMLVRSHKRTRHSLAVKVPFVAVTQPATTQLVMSKEVYEQLFGAKSSEPPTAGKFDITEDAPTHTE